jgi:DNA polymerase-4
VSAETTFDHDVSEAKALARRLWPLCETVCGRLKRAELAGRTVVLKLKTDRFRLLTRSHRLEAPTQLAETLYRTALPMLEAEATGTRYRLIGIGLADIVPADEADPPNLFDPDLERRRGVERAIDAVRARLGADAIVKGRSLPEGSQQEGGTGSRSVRRARTEKSP